MRDGARHAGRIADRVIAGQAGTVSNAHANDRYRLARARVLVGECAGAARNEQRFTTDQAAQAATRQLRRQRAVIDARGGRHARHRQRFRRDVGHQAGRVADRIVGGQATVTAVDQGRAGGRHRLADAGVFVVEGSRQARRAQRLRTDQAADRAARQSRLAVSVVDLVDGRHAGNRQGLRRDIAGAAAGGAVQAVVIRIGTAQGDAADSHRLAVAGILVSKRGACRAQRQAVAAHHAVEHGTGRADGGLGIGVIDLAVGHDVGNTADEGLADGGRHAGRIADRVVANHAAIGANAQGRAADGDRFARVGVLVGKDTAHARHVEGFRTDQAAQHHRTTQGRIDSAVIHPVAGRHAGNRQRFGRDIARHARRGVQGIIAGQASALDQRRASDDHGLAGASILVGKRACQAGHAHGFAAHQAIQGAARQAGLGIAVVDLGAGRHAAERQRLWRDITGDASQWRQGVVGAGAAAQRGGGIDGDIAAGILAGVAAGQRTDTEIGQVRTDGIGQATAG